MSVLPLPRNPVSYLSLINEPAFFCPVTHNACEDRDLFGVAFWNCNKGHIRIKFINRMFEALKSSETPPWLTTKLVKVNEEIEETQTIDFKTLLRDPTICRENRSWFTKGSDKAELQRVGPQADNSHALLTDDGKINFDGLHYVNILEVSSYEELARKGKSIAKKCGYSCQNIDTEDLFRTCPLINQAIQELSGPVPATKGELLANKLKANTEIERLVSSQNKIVLLKQKIDRFLRKNGHILLGCHLSIVLCLGAATICLLTLFKLIINQTFVKAPSKRLSKYGLSLTQSIDKKIFLISQGLQFYFKRCRIYIHRPEWAQHPSERYSNSKLRENLNMLVFILDMKRLLSK